MLRSEIAAVCLFAVGIICAVTAFGLIQNGWRGAVAVWVMGAALVSALCGSGYLIWRLDLLPPPSHSLAAPPADHTKTTAGG